MKSLSIFSYISILCRVLFSICTHIYIYTFFLAGGGGGERRGGRGGEKGVISKKKILGGGRVMKILGRSLYSIKAI